MNINEIAKLAGVSRATVSRYLNDGYVSEEKRTVIKRVINETGFVPSAHTQTLRTKKTKLIGVILPKINSDSISRIVEGISGILGEKDYQVLLANTFNNEKKELEFLQLFQENRVDGIILIATIFTSEHKRLLKELQVPIVMVGQHLSGYSSVYHDDEGAAQEITNLMIQAGGKKYGLIGATLRDEAVGQQRRSGFLKSLNAAGISTDETSLKEAEFNADSGYELTRELLNEHPDVDSIFCATDTIALGVIEYIRDVGKKIPEDIQVIGFGDSKIARVLTPRLTTVHLAYRTSGEEAARIILEALDEKQEAIREVKMGFRIVEGESLKK